MYREILVTSRSHALLMNRFGEAFLHDEFSQNVPLLPQPKQLTNASYCLQLRSYYLRALDASMSFLIF